MYICIFVRKGIRGATGARIADAKLNPITGRTLNNYKYAGQFITVERGPCIRYRVQCSAHCARRLKILFFFFLLFILIYILYTRVCVIFHLSRSLSLFFSLSPSLSLSLVLHSFCLYYYFFLNELRTAPDVGYRYPWSHEASFCRIANVR